MARLAERLLEDKGLRAFYDASTAKRELALALRALRKGAGLTQAQIAAKSGLTQSHISKMESPTGPMPTTESLNRYADACGSDLCVAFPAKGTRATELSAEAGVVCAVL